MKATFFGLILLFSVPIFARINVFDVLGRDRAVQRKVAPKETSMTYAEFKLFFDSFLVGINDYGATKGNFTNIRTCVWAIPDIIEAAQFLYQGIIENNINLVVAGLQALMTGLMQELPTCLDMGEGLIVLLDRLYHISFEGMLNFLKTKPILLVSDLGNVVIRFIQGKYNKAGRDLGDLIQAAVLNP